MRGTRGWVVLAVATALFVVAPSGHASLTPPPSFTVTSTADTPDASPGDGTCADSLGHCTLRAAIQEANAKTGMKVVKFDIAGSGVHTISPATALPAITEPLGIDGYSQPGSSVNTLTTGDNAVLDILLQGPNSAAYDGLDVSAGGGYIEGLVITGFGNEVKLSGTGDEVVGDYLGTNATGTADGSTSTADVSVDGADAVVGEDGASFRNVMGGGAAGVVIGSQGALVENNEIGVAAPGSASLGIADGVYVNGFSASGGSAVIHDNVASCADGPAYGCITIDQGSGDTIQANLVGLTADGTAALPSVGAGIEEHAAADDVIAGNVVAACSGAGIHLSPGSHGATLQGNEVGTNEAGTAALGNAGAGILLENAGGNLIGGMGAGDGNLVSGNGVSPGNVNWPGIYLYQAAATGNVIEGNTIGTNAAGTAPLPNASAGILALSASGNTIGVSGAGNLISGNGGAGIWLYGSGSTGIQGDTIGTNAAGTAALGNTGSGILLSNSAPSNVIGGTTAGDPNLISGNGSSGVWLDGSGTTGNLVEGNEIGTDRPGDAALGNGFTGVFVNAAPGNTIGGTAAGAGNLISGNVSAGVWLDQATTTVQGNTIGTNAAGTSAIANGGDGVFVQGGSDSTVGGTAAGAGNLVSGNGSNGVDVQSDSATVQGNTIGADVSGTSAIPNAAKGVYVAGSNNLIGGTAAGAANTIAFNGRPGIDVISGSGNSILENSIFGNAVLGIDLGDDGVTPNDAGDGDTGPNALQNFPTLTTAATDTHSGTTIVGGTLNSASDSAFTVELFVSDSCDASGNGQGARLLASFAVATGPDGNAAFSRDLADIPVGKTITATATDSAGDTSEFSGCLAVTETRYALSVAKAGSGSGSVTGSGIDCGATCSGDYTDPTQVTLTATPAAGSTFAGWSGACSGAGACTVTMSAARSVTATFDAIPDFTLLVALAGNGSGAVTSSPAGIACGATCSQSYASGTAVSLSAVAAAGSTFAGWSGACSGTGGCTVTMDAAKSVTAAFDTAAPAKACIVPKVTGKTVAAAKRAIKAAGCSVGKVAFVRKGKKGRVLSQAPKPHTRLKPGAKVNLVVGKGK